MIIIILLRNQLFEKNLEARAESNYVEVAAGGQTLEEQQEGFSGITDARSPAHACYKQHFKINKS